MQFRILIVAVVLALMSACTTVPIGPENVTLLTAKNVERDKGPSGVTDSFTFEGLIYVFASITWNTNTSLGNRAFEVRWYNGETMKFKQAHQVTLKRAPWYVYFRATGSALGEGDCRVEVYADDVLLGTQKFTVTAQ
jgi:hypothetical protein